MKSLKCTSILTIIVSTLFSFNVFAMPKNLNAEEPKIPSPQTEIKNDDKSFDYLWTWLNDELCVRFNGDESIDKAYLNDRWNRGLITGWGDEKNRYETLKNRDTYTGKWTQTVDGIWSFLFDDYTIPVGVTKIDGVLYAFNGYGELQAGYEYYTGCKTAADGLVTADSAEFQAWLATQYVPECTSHE